MMETQPQQELRSNAAGWIGWLGLPAVLLFAFGLAFFSGLRGLFPLDQAIVFDGAWRVHCGQVPYRDFHAPVGPVVFWLQGGLFHWLGVHWYAYVAGAAIQNAVGAACVWTMLRMLHPKQPGLALAGAALTAAWLYAPFGTTYPEQTAFVAILLGLTFLLSGQSPSGTAPAWRSAGLLALAGATAVVGLLSKHNAGLFGLAGYLALGLATAPVGGKRRLLHAGAFLSGFLLAAGAFCGWLYCYSDPAAFYEQVISIPGRAGAERLFGGGLLPSLRGLASGKGSEDVRASIVAAGALFLVAGFVAWKQLPAGDERRRRILASSALGLALIGVQNLFSLTSHNGGTNEKPFLGLLFALAVAGGCFLAEIFAKPPISASEGESKIEEPWPTVPPFPRQAAWLALGAGLLATVLLSTASLFLGVLAAVLALDGVGALQRAKRQGGGGRWLPWQAKSRLIAGGVVLFVHLLVSGTAVSVYRLVHEPFLRPGKAPPVFAVWTHSRFEKPLAAPGLAGIRWGEPTGVARTTIAAEEVDLVVARLRQEGKGRPFFVFPDCTFLYAAVGTPSPQPLLWFHKGLTYPAVYSEPLDRKIVHSLEEHGVSHIVLERESFFGTQARLDDFPHLKRFIAEEFTLSESIGIFQIHRRKTGATEPSPIPPLQEAALPGARPR